MATESRVMQVGGVKVEVVCKDIKNLHLGVYPPHGRVRVAAPLVVNDEAVRLHLLERHSERFMALMDGFMPNWRVCRETLNSGVLGHEVWGY